MTNAEQYHAKNAYEAMVTIDAGVEKDIWAHRIPFETPLDALAGLAAVHHLTKRLGKERAHAILNTLLKQMHIPVESLATETYWSRAPIAIGKEPLNAYNAVAIKYRLAPVAIKSGKAERCEDLEEEFYTRLENDDIRFLLQVQTYIDDEQTPIEDARIAWPHNFVTVGELIIPQQNKSREERKAEMKEVDALTFNPWKCDSNFFLPLGSLNRMRKIAYPLAVKART